MSEEKEKHRMFGGPFDGEILEIYPQTKRMQIPRVPKEFMRAKFTAMYDPIPGVLPNGLPEDFIMDMAIYDREGDRFVYKKTERHQYHKDGTPNYSEFVEDAN